MDNITENIWIVIGVIVVAVLIMLIYKSKGLSKSKIKYKQNTIREDIDFDNIINSSFHSKELYNKLKVKCHPDRYVDNDRLNLIACELFQEITKNKTNLKRLEELKNEAIEKLNINLN